MSRFSSCCSIASFDCSASSFALHSFPTRRSSDLYQPEVAYFETLHEVKLIVDLMYEGGIENMRYSISDTAQWGDFVSGPRVINDETKARMKEVLDDIQTGKFAQEWILENQANRPRFNAINARENNHPIEKVGKELRDLMPFVKKSMK